MCSSIRLRKRPRKSCWTLTRRTTRCMANRRASFSRVLPQLLLPAVIRDLRRPCARRQVAHVGPRRGAGLHRSAGRARHVIAKAEHLRKGANPRFIVTNLPDGCADLRALYENHYCARGEMENRIKEQQLGLFADRTSTHHLSSDQLRLWFSTAAYTLINPLRRVLIHFASAPYQPLFQKVWQPLQHCPLRR